MLITDIFSVFKKGQELSNSAVWKERTIATNVLIAFLTAAVSVATGLGYNVSFVDQDVIQNAATGIVSFVTMFNIIMHYATSSKVGLSNKTKNS